MMIHRVALIGLRGSGKSSVGRALARRLDLLFLDSDQILAERHATSASALFAELGELEFRRREIEVIREASAAPSGVLALGGGAPTQPQNRLALDPWSVVWLDAPDEVLVERILADRKENSGSRPPLTDKDDRAEMAEIRRLRCEDYGAFANLCVDSSVGTPEQIASDLVNRLEGS